MTDLLTSPPTRWDARRRTAADFLTRVTLAVSGGCASIGEIERATGMSRTTVAKYVAIAREAGLIQDLADAAGRPRYATIRPTLGVVAAADLEDLR